MKRLSLVSILVLFVLLVPSGKMAFAEGGIAWGSAGKPVCTVSGNQQNLRMVPDDSGGAIIVWQDYRNGPEPDIYTQRIDKDGTPKWDLNGVVVCNEMGRQENPVITGDGSDGAIIAWEDYRGGTISAIYAVRISSTGATHLLWPTNGIQLSASAYSQCLPEIAIDGQNGAIVVWEERGIVNYSVYCQRIDGNGTIPSLWGAGVLVSSGTLYKEYPKIINDGTGNVIISWQDFGAGDYDIYAQRVNIASGTVDSKWATNGQQVSEVSGSDQKNPQIVPDGRGGAIVTWTDCRNDNGDIYAQWISSAGAQIWETVTGSGDFEGIPICQAIGEQTSPVIVSRIEVETIVGAIFAWEDRKDDPNGDIYATGINLDIGTGWTADAIPIATGGQIQMLPRLVNDIQGGGIGAWIEKDLPAKDKIFATKRGEEAVLLWKSYPGVLVCQGSRIVNHQVVSDDAGGIIVAWQAEGTLGDYDIFAQRVMDDAYILSASICGRVTLSDGKTGITGVEVWALKNEELVSSAITDTKGSYKITGLTPESTYLVRANWSANGIESSVCKEAFAPSYLFNFTLELDYELGTIAGNVSGVEREAKRVSGSGLGQSLSSASGIAFVELEQRGKILVKVPLEIDGNYNIPNLLPGKFVARAYNGSIYSNSRTVNLKEGETLRVDFAFGMMPEEEVYNYPNPAKGGSTTIRYYCGYADPETEIKIYNIAGELVRKVKDNEINRDGTDPHIYKFFWDCENSSGKEVSSGIYIYAVEVKEKGGSESKKVSKRMAVIR